MRRAIASCLGLGLLPRKLWGHHGGAGTVGAAGALALAVLLGRLGIAYQVIGLAALVGLTLWSVGPLAEGDADPPWVCVDEAAGTFLAVLGLGGVVPLLVAFTVFRVADITKRTPLMDGAQRLPGALGVLADDLVAGAYGLAIGWVVQTGLSGLG